MATSHRENSEDSDTGYPESGCGDDGKNDGCGGGPNGGKAMAAGPTQLLELAPEAGPARRLATLSDLMISSGSVATSCRSLCIPA